MANRYAVQNGNWSDPATWDGGTLPGVADDVYANRFTVTIDQDVECNQISTAASSPAISGGVFLLTTPQNLICHIDAGTSSCLSITAPVSVSIIGNVTGRTNSNNCHGIYLTANASISITGNVTGSIIGGNTAGIYAIAPATNVTLDITGDVYGKGVVSTIPTIVTVTGNVTGGYSSPYMYGLHCTAESYITINGNVLGGNTVNSCFGIYLQQAGGTVTINGNVTASGSHGVYVNNSAASVDLNGTLEASNSAEAAYLIGPTQVRVRGPLIHASNSRAPLLATHWAVHAGVNTSWQALDDAAYPNGNPIVLTNYVSDSPPPADVREGTVYGADNSLTGTMKVPPPSAVRQGVAVDGTVGTAALEVDDIASAVGAQIQGVLNG